MKAVPLKRAKRQSFRDALEELSETKTNLLNISDPKQGTVLSWLYSRTSLSLQDVHLLFKDNRKLFISMFGKPAGTFVNEGAMKVWLLENGVVVCAGKVKGTVYEVPISWTFQQTQSFLEDLISSIKGI